MIAIIAVITVVEIRSTDLPAMQGLLDSEQLGRLGGQQFGSLGKQVVGQHLAVGEDDGIVL